MAPPLATMNTIPNSMWCRWRPPGVTFFGHQLTSARMRRVLTRMKPKPATTPTSNQKKPALPGSLM